MAQGQAGLRGGLEPSPSQEGKPPSPQGCLQLCLGLGDTEQVVRLPLPTPPPLTRDSPVPPQREAGLPVGSAPVGLSVHPTLGTRCRGSVEARASWGVLKGPCRAGRPPDNGASLVLS